MAEKVEVPFGLADITIGEGAEAITFDGAANFQADGGEVTLTPILQEVKIADFGESVYDEVVTGYTGRVLIVAAEDKIQMMKLALSSSEDITSTTNSEVVGLMDAKIGTSLRKKAKKVRIHPRSLPATDKSKDIVIYKMASNGEFNRSFANEQGNVQIELNMYPRDGMDASKPGNFFYRGPVDPNSVVTP
ncbi:hypothetical protein [Priestia sp. GS2]|uniref:hypothetical protein n=1 Tax=Priestia sp. GS2 TaxID=3117403 RepID=UPI002EDB28CD